MNGYLILTDPQFIWSYSKLGCYGNCKYQFYLKYIEGLSEEPRFFSQFGSFCHELLADYFEGKTKFEELATRYLCEFKRKVNQPAPNPKIFTSYFNGGLEYFKNKDNFDFDDVEAVEKKFWFNIGDKKFVGIADLITKSYSGRITLVDHKSKALKDYSNRKTKTKNDQDLDRMFKQLYIYTIPAAENGWEIDDLMFNCFRVQNKIKHRFDLTQLDEVKKWVLDTIDEIEHTERWTPNIDEFFCRWLCGMGEQCEYYAMNFGGRK